MNQNVRGEVASQFDGETLTLEFIQPCDTIDEDSRLREASSLMRFVWYSTVLIFLRKTNMPFSLVAYLRMTWWRTSNH